MTELEEKAMRDKELREKCIKLALEFRSGNTSDVIHEAALYFSYINYGNK